MRCHYEVLEVPRDADDETIKKAYRKLALKWHPDKNPDRIEECTKYFALLQSAYEVLSDPHEKAFYDRHRESILKGGFDADYKNDSLDLFQFFTTSCYKGFEGDKSFYNVYRNVFDSLANEDYDYVDDPSVRYPSFGDASSDYETIVGPFYGFWSSFCTARSFAWLDKYDIRQANNRYELRQIEAENKKYRDAGKAERNDQIRELAAFVRRRDPRVKAYRELLEKRQEEAKKKQEENRKQQILKNQQLISAYNENEHAMAAHREYLAQLSQQMAEEDTSSEVEDESGDALLYCDVCDKSFKTLNAKSNHENSKQHRKQLAELKKHMKEEDHALFEEQQNSPEPSPEKQDDRKGKKAKRRAKKKKAWDDGSDGEGGDINENPEKDDAEMSATEEVVSGLSEKLAEASVEAADDGSPEEENIFLAAAKQTEKKRRRADKKESDGNVNDTTEHPSQPVDTGPKIGTCHKCKEVFESRTKLFEHLKLTGHATIKGPPPPPPKNKKGEMDFEDPKPEDLDFDFSLENAGCLITVRKYKEFDDESAQKIFPRSSAEYIPSDTYTLPANYFCDLFWKNEKERLQRVYGLWVANRDKLTTSVIGEASEDVRFLDCMSNVVRLINMYDLMLSMCWEGDRSKPPMPLHLYKARLSELKEVNTETIKNLKELSNDREFNRKRVKSLKMAEMAKDSPKPKFQEQGEQSPPWRISLMERINEILVVLDTAATAGENVGEALTLVMDVRQCIKSGNKDSHEQVSAKMKRLNDLVVTLKKATTARIKAMSKEDNLPLASSGSKSQPDLPKLGSTPAQTPQPSSGRKRGRPRIVRNRDDEEYVEKKRSTPVITSDIAVVGDPDDDLVSRVKRGQRNRRPARTFTPGWELSSPSPPPPKTRVTPTGKATPSVEQKPKSLASKGRTNELSSPDSGRPSSNESSDNVSTVVNEKPKVNPIYQDNNPTVANIVTTTVSIPTLPTTPVLSTPTTSYYTTATPLSGLVPPTNTFSTPETSVPVSQVLLNPPPVPQLNDQTVMALLKERVQLGDVRLTLLNLLASEGTPHYHFIPLMIETAEKAIAALDKKDMIVYAMHKAALEVGCAQLETIMRASNPIDPSNQLATLATAMGISPTPFTSLLQNSTATSLNSNLLAADAATREQLTASYSLPPTVSMEFQGYTERDISSFLL